MRSRHRNVDTPTRIEHPLVRRVIHSSNDTRHAEFLLGKERDDQVVFIITGYGNNNVGAIGFSLCEFGNFTAIDYEPLHACGFAVGLRLRNTSGINFDNQNFVTSLLEFGGDVGAYVSATCNDDAHQ